MKKVSINDKVEEKIIEIDSVNVNNNLIVNLKKLIEVPVSRGVYKPQEVGSVGKIYNDLNEDIVEGKTSPMSIKNLNNIKILIELSISRGGYLTKELNDVGNIYNELLKIIQP